MFRTLAFPVTLILLAGLLAGGCTSLDSHKNSPAAKKTEFPPVTNASYRQAINQPDATSALIRMDTDIYNTGEILEFAVINNGSSTLRCVSDPPGFSVNYQSRTGQWVVKHALNRAGGENTTNLEKGESSPEYRLDLSGWEPGRYRIVSDCGPVHEFLVRESATVSPDQTPVMNVTGSPGNCTMSPSQGTTPWIQIDPFGVPHAYRGFTIQGTTNLPPGEELSYSIYSVPSAGGNASYSSESTFTTVIEEGSCGINRWSAMGEIQATGDFFIGISDKTKKAVAVKRFTVYP